MSIPILPLAEWPEGINQASIPANDNANRMEILSGLVLSDAVTAQPAGVEGAIYILPGTHTGAQWSTFDEDDLTIYKGGTWHAFAPIDGVVVNFSGHQEQFTGSGGWAALAGGTFPDAEDVAYDNAVSGLAATDVQAAIDELAAAPSGGGGIYTRGATWSGGGSAVAAPAEDVSVVCHTAGTITAATILTAGGTGSCVIDVWKDTFTNYPPAVGDSITASAKPTVSSSNKARDTTLTGWATSVAAGDILRFHLESTSNFTNVHVALEITP